MTWAPVARGTRQKVKRFTRRQLHRIALADRLRTGGQATYERAAEKARDREARKAEAAFKDCELR
jgi:hypothetical protein